MTGNEHLASGTSPAKQKPRLVLMGEFSSGKSTLSNILLGGPTLPMQVTATRLPPVHVSHGEPSAHAITRDGEKIAVDVTHLADMTPDTIRSIHITMLSDTLELCDLVDMPGISDPNMSTDTWDSVVGKTDHVIWCTHATQAWRQTEAAFWGQMRDTTSGQNLLLVTQFDKLTNPRDKARVLNRILKETEGQFTAVYPVALLDALKAEEDFEAWKASGANDFMEHLIEILLTSAEEPQDHAALETADLHRFAVAEGSMEVVQAQFGKAEQPHSLSEFGVTNATTVIPRRVKLQPDKRRLTRPLRANWSGGTAWPVEPGAA